MGAQGGSIAQDAAFGTTAGPKSEMATSGLLPDCQHDRSGGIYSPFGFPSRQIAGWGHLQKYYTRLPCRFEAWRTQYACHPIHERLQSKYILWYD